MRKERKIINTKIRLNLLDEKDRQAWEYLQSMDRKKYKSYTKAVVTALNDHFSRQEKLLDDPFLESRQKEDEFLRRIEEAVERGAKQSMPLVLAESFLSALRPAMMQIAANSQILPESNIGNGMRNHGIWESNVGEEEFRREQELLEQEEAEDAALDFADGF